MATVSTWLGGWLPTSTSVTVSQVFPITSVEVLRAVWKALRNKLASEGDVQRALAAAAVLSALDTRPSQLIAATLKTGGGELLVWIDTSTGAPIACFTDPAVYLAGLAG